MHPQPFSHIFVPKDVSTVHHTCGTPCVLAVSCCHVDNMPCTLIISLRAEPRNFHSGQILGLFTAGRSSNYSQRGRLWIAPFGLNFLCLSLFFFLFFSSICRELRPFHAASFIGQSCPPTAAASPSAQCFQRFGCLLDVLLPFFPFASRAMEDSQYAQRSLLCWRLDRRRVLSLPVDLLPPLNDGEGPEEVSRDERSRPRR